MNSSETWTVGRLLTWTTDYLGKADSDTPRLDAELLLAEARGCPRIELYTRYEEPADEQTRTAFRELVRRRAEGMPVAYLLGRKEFYSLDFRVTQDVLIPRPETEFVLITLFDLLKERGREADWKIADLGTGSGILAICAARELPNAEITAIDTSRAALDVASKNAADHGVANRITFLESDLFSILPESAQFDVIVSNPPYVSTTEYQSLPTSVRDFEPRVALEAGSEGTEIIERLVQASKNRLRPDGYLIVEISPMILDATRAIIESAGCFDQVTTVRDLSQHPRVVSARRVD